MNDSVEYEMEMQGEGQTQPQTTAGALLRRAREQARIPMASMAAMLKVPQHKLQALEADDYEAFPDHVFMRALAMGMCRSLRMDAAPVLELLPRTELKGLGNGAGINETVKERSFKGTGTPVYGRESGSRKIVVGVLLLLAAAAAVYFVPLHQPQSPESEAAATGQAASMEEGRTIGTGAAPAEAAPPQESGAVGAGAAPAAAASTAAAPAATAGAEGRPAQEVPAAGAAVAPASAPGTAGAEAGAASAAPASATSAADAKSAAAAVLTMRASAQSWVRVKDASGRVVLERTLAQDETVTADGALPLSVTVGNAKGTQVTVRGEPLDIVKGTRDNVARFEVK